MKASVAAKTKGGRGGARRARTARTQHPAVPLHGAILEEAQRAGLLDGDKTEHVSFRAPPALVEAARRCTGVSSATELGILALALLAQPDPVTEFMRRTRGRLGKGHALES